MNPSNKIVSYWFITQRFYYASRIRHYGNSPLLSGRTSCGSRQGRQLRRNANRLFLKFPLSGRSLEDALQAHPFVRSIPHTSVQSQPRFAAIGNAPELGLGRFAPLPSGPGCRRGELVTYAPDHSHFLAEK